MTRALSCVIFPAMDKLKLLTGARLRENLRWAKQNVYSWLILPLIVIGISYATVARVVHNAPSWHSSVWAESAISFALLLCVVGLSLSRSTADLYFVNTPESVAEWLPVDLNAKLGVAFANRLLRVFLIGLALVFAKYMLMPAGVSIGFSILAAASLCLLLCITELLAALEWVRWNHTQRLSKAAIPIFLILLSLVLSSFLMLDAINPEMMPRRWNLGLPIAGIALAAVIFVYVQFRHRKYRSRDIEYARRLWQTRKISVFDWHSIRSKFGPAVGNLLARDLQLTLRAFTSTVYIVLALACLSIVILAVVLFTHALPPPPKPLGKLDTTWLPSVMATKIAVILATSGLSTLVAPLVAAQLQNLWIEKTVGTNGLQMWEAKVWYARLISLPVPFIATLIAIVSGSVPVFYWLPLFLESLLLWLLCSSFIGALAYEMPDEPVLACIVMFTVGTAMPLMAAFFWPAGILIFIYVMGALTSRGRERARVYLLTENI
ncbi:MAG TPA: hypothetical protein VFC63_17015 [Blastocatellia bacterium]|nr:hypothetical protein [Blastocatellia bacterium]